MAKKVLIVDDDVDLVEAVEMLLEAKGYVVISANNGEEGFKMAKAQSPDLILLDAIMLHQSEGFETARNLKNDKATENIPVVMLTGIKKEMGLPFGFKPDEDWLPVKAVLEKPVKQGLLLKTVEEFIRK